MRTTETYVFFKYSNNRMMLYNLALSNQHTCQISNSITRFVLFLAHMYLYEGKDYSKEPSAEDKKTFEHLLDLENVLLADAGREGRALRNKSDVSQISSTSWVMFSYSAVKSDISFWGLYHLIISYLFYQFNECPILGSFSKAPNPVLQLKSILQVL